MSRYIDVDKLTEAFVKAAKQVGNIGDQIAFRMIINEIPTADVRENVRGEWIDRGKDMTIRWQCSECGRKDTHIYNFCPNCGADMRGNNHD